MIVTSAKDTWNILKEYHGNEKVHNSKLQTPRREFKN